MLATVAFDLGIINQTFFVTLVLIAIVTSLLAGYWFKYVLSKGWPLLEGERLESLALPVEERRELPPFNTPIAMKGDIDSGQI